VTEDSELILVRKPRSGKGTIQRILVALVGPDNSTGYSLERLATDFGSSALVNKLIAQAEPSTERIQGIRNSTGASSLRSQKPSLGSVPPGVGVSGPKVHRASHLGGKRLDPIPRVGSKRLESGSRRVEIPTTTRRSPSNPKF
jgi:hypothetical protein